MTNVDDIYESLDELRDEIIEIDLKYSQTIKLLNLILEIEQKITEREVKE